MNNISHKKLKGFTLIEMLIAVAILGIIAAIAFPSYQEQVRKSKRKDAVYALTDIANRMERYYSENNTYVITDLTDINLDDPATSPDGLYTLQVRGLATTYTARAIPVTGKSQASDSSCTAFQLTSVGARTATGTLGNDCWK